MRLRRAFLIEHAFGFPVVPEVNMKSAVDAIVRTAGLMGSASVRLVGGKDRTAGEAGVCLKDPRFKETVVTVPLSDFAASAACTAISGVEMTRDDDTRLIQCSNVASLR